MLCYDHHRGHSHQFTFKVLLFPNIGECIGYYGVSYIINGGVCCMVACGRTAAFTLPSMDSKHVLDCFVGAMQPDTCFTLLTRQVPGISKFWLYNSITFAQNSKTSSTHMHIHTQTRLWPPECTAADHLHCCKHYKNTKGTAVRPAPAAVFM